MIHNKLNRSLNIINRSVCDKSAYTEFLQTAFDIFVRSGSYLAPCEDIKFEIPEKICDEFDGLVPVVLYQGEKLYVATTDMNPCVHGWPNIHPNNIKPAVVNENSAVPMDIVTSKPPVCNKYAGKLKPPAGSADMTTDWFKRGAMIWRKPILWGAFRG